MGRRPAVMSARYSCTCSSRDFSPARPAASVPTSAASVLTLASFTSRSRCSTPAHGAFACQGHHAGSEQIYRHQHHSVVNSYIAHPLCGIRIIPHMPSWLQASKVERPVKQARTDLLCFCRAHLSRDIGKHLLTLLGAILQGHALWLTPAALARKGAGLRVHSALTSRMASVE